MRKKGKIIARYEDGMSIAEIANRMNISTKFVENMLTEAGLLK